MRLGIIALTPLGLGLIEVIAVVIACVLVQAFFAASEIALVSADKLKVAAESARGARDARMLAGLLDRRDRLLALTLTGTNVATVIAAAVLTSFLAGFGGKFSYLAPFILAPVTLLLGESIPKLLTLKDPLKWARFAARPLRVMAVVLVPLLQVETWLSRALKHLLGAAPEALGTFLSREDLVMLIHRRGPRDADDAILPAEGRMIGRIFRFTRAEARQVMVPLVKVEAVRRETTVAGAIEVVRREGFSRLPVFDRRIVDIVGVVHVFDLLQAPDLDRPVSEVMRPVSYFAEAMPLDEILLALQRTGENLGVVVDEYGGAAGILTVEDLLEEVVGEIEDEHDQAEELARVINPRTLSVSADAPVTALNERFGLGLPESAEYATIGGLVVERLGHIPQPGAQVKAAEVMVTVVRSDARAVREVVLTLARPLRPDQVRRR